MRLFPSSCESPDQASNRWRSLRVRYPIPSLVLGTRMRRRMVLDLYCAKSTPVPFHNRARIRFMPSCMAVVSPSAGDWEG